VDGSDEPWVFPFDKPLPPSEGDNQAAAFNTTDGSMVYDVAFALVWAEGDEVLNVNEAHAYASCSNCVTVAVAFQVVLIMDDANVVVPQNLAVAANYQCYRCITAALASQLVLSVNETPGEEQLLALSEVWNRLAEFGRSITAFSLVEISTQLEAFQAEIVAILGDAPPVVPTSTSTQTASQSGAPVPGASEPSPAGSPTASPDSPAGPSEPSSSEPSQSEPSPDTEPTTTEPSPSEPTTTEPSPSEPTTSEPTPEQTAETTADPASPEATTDTATSPASSSP
jgi:putative peptide zinc metalloprotease protein